MRAYQTSIDGNNINILGFVGWKGRVTPNQVSELSKGGIEPIFGTDLLMRGDFESYSLYGTGERTWETKNATSELTNQSRNGLYAQKVNPLNDSVPARFAQKVFMRVLPSNVLSITGYLKSKGNVHVTGPNIGQGLWTAIHHWKRPLS